MLVGLLGRGGGAGVGGLCLGWWWGGMGDFWASSKFSVFGQWYMYGMETWEAGRKRKESVYLN